MIFLENVVGENSPYAAVFIPGGHGVLAKIPHSEVKKVLKWAVEQEKFIITLCHGPASLLAAAVDEQPEIIFLKIIKFVYSLTR